MAGIPAAPGIPAWHTGTESFNSPPAACDGHEPVDADALTAASPETRGGGAEGDQ